MKIAAVQFDVALAQPEQNVERMASFLKQTAAEGAQLTVFPECAVSGYCYESADEARPVAQSIPGPATQWLAEACRAYGQQHVIAGMLEADGEAIYNAAVLVGPEGVVGSYRKVHLPFLGIDRFARFGDRPFAVHAVHDTRIGMNICYDASFPEAARCLTLLGADLIALPTNWPPGAQCVAQSTISCRALENAVYFLAVNRVGTERGFRFIGQSQICDPAGRILHRADEFKEEVFYAEIDVRRARKKHLVRVRGQHEIDRLADRRPEMYQPLVQPHQLQRPGRDR